MGRSVQEHGSGATSTGRNHSRAAWVAGDLEAEIIRRGWPVGESIGSEAVLTERYGVSRPVLREAFRILESRWVAKPRPGPGGGLVVTAPQSSMVRDVTRLFIDYVGFSQQDLFSTLETLEVAAIEKLAQEIDQEGIEQLRAAVRLEAESDDPRTTATGVHMEIGRLSRNPFFDLFIFVLSDLSRRHGVTTTVEQRKWINRKHAALVEAIIAGDVLTAKRVLKRLIVEFSREASLDVDTRLRPSFQDDAPAV